MKKIISFAIILFLILSGTTKADNIYDDYNLLLDIANDMDTKVEEGNISFNGMIKDEFMNEKEITKLGEEIREDLDIEGEKIDPLIDNGKLSESYYTKEVIFDEGFSQITYIGHDTSNNKISIILSSYLDPQGVEAETYLYINIIKVDDFLKINDIIDDIDNIYRNFNISAEINSCLIGTISGKVKEEDMESRVETILKDVEGEVINKHGDEFYSSYTIYSPLIKDYLEIDKKKINLNLAIRYNDYEDKTYIIIGTPVITIGY